MGLSDAEVSDLLRQCVRQRRWLIAVRAFDAWCQLVWPGAALILCGLTAARLLRWPTEALPFVASAVGLGAGTLIWRRRASLVVPRWHWVAHVDRYANAQGALMHCFATGAPTSSRVPRIALALQLRPAAPTRSLLGSVLIAGAYAACLAWPL